nr:uncharacterized protein LOC109185271 [Ipomoea trifida]
MGRGVLAMQKTVKNLMVVMIVGWIMNGSEEDLISYALGNDDEEFDNNIDVNVEYGGLDDIEVQHQEKASLAAVACDEISYSDEGSIASSDRKRKETAKVFERD